MNFFKNTNELEKSKIWKKDDRFRKDKELKSYFINKTFSTKNTGMNKTTENALIEIKDGNRKN